VDARSVPDFTFEDEKMKRCPTCQKTFDDAMRFCQTDGTPLVEDAAPADPYKTMVASKEDIAAALRSQYENEPAQAGIGAPEDEPLQIPAEPVPSRAPESELETKLAGRDDAQVIEIPPLAETPQAESPSFGAPKAAPTPFGNSVPPSPFGSSEPSGAGDFPTTPPIPSPFSGAKPPSTPKAFEPEPATPVRTEPERPAIPRFEPEPEPEPTYFEPVSESPKYAEPERATPLSFSPFEQQSASSAPPAAQSDWQMQTPGQGGTGMTSPPPVAGQKLNQTLPIISLVAAIVSICCWISPLTGLIALITGFLGMKNANSNPTQYGGKTLAIVGMIVGGLLFFVGIAYWIFVVFFNGAALLMQMANQR